jgi:uridine kinase
MTASAGSDEPVIERWTATDLSSIAALLTADAGLGPVVIAVDGRSGSGKTTFASALALHLDASLLSTDDFAWWHSYFDWPDMLVELALVPLRRGEPVDVRPPAWVERGREGSITAPARPVLVVEGVGAGQERMRTAVDRIVWVQSQEVEAERRGLTRDLRERPDPVEAKRFWDEWMAVERPFQERQRTWQWADLVVCGTPGVLGVDPAPQWLCAAPDART